MKYIIPALFFCFLSFSQTNDSIYNKAKMLYTFSFKLDSLSKLKPNYNFKPNNISLLSVYNRNTKLNDIYYIPKDSIYYAKSIVFNTYQLTKQDSFNPNGVSNLGAGLIIGSINTVFNFIFK